MAKGTHPAAAIKASCEKVVIPLVYVIWIIVLFFWGESNYFSEKMVILDSKVWNLVLDSESLSPLDKILYLRFTVWNGISCNIVGKFQILENWFDIHGL